MRIVFMILRWFIQWESVDTAVEDMKEQVELVLPLLLLGVFSQ